MFVPSTADSFETMLKSLLGYQSGSGAGVTESLMRKKVYEGAINQSLENHFPVLLQVCILTSNSFTFNERVFVQFFFHIL